MQVFLDHGIAVTAGMIVGFDHDGYDIFQRQYDFAMANPVPIFTLGALVAPVSTPLYDRMEKAGRLVKDGSENARRMEYQHQSGSDVARGNGRRFEVVGQ